MGNEQKFYGWKLVGALWLLYFLNMGFPLYGGTVINPVMLKEIPMERATFGLAYSLLNFFIGVPSFLIAAAIMKWGIRFTFGIGSALIVIGTLWMSFFATKPWHYLIGFGVIIGSGIGFGTVICLSTAVTRWFVRFRGRAMAIAMTASGFAGLVGAPLMNMIMTANNGNWRMAWLYVTGIAILSAIVAFAFVKERPEDLGQVPDGGVAPAGPSGPKAALATMYDWTPAEAYRTSSFWMIVIGACACQYPFFFFTAHWIMHLRGLGISPAIYAFAMGLFTMGGIFGRLIGGWLMDRMPARYAFMLGLCCYFVGSALAMILTKDTLFMAYTAAVLYGAGFGWTFVCMNTVTGNFYGMKAFPKLNGMVMMLSAIICSPAGVIGGKLFDMFKSYNPAFELNIAIGVVGIIALVFAKMPKAPNASNSATVSS